MKGGSGLVRVAEGARALEPGGGRLLSARSARMAGRVGGAGVRSKRDAPVAVRASPGARPSRGPRRREKYHTLIIKKHASSQRAPPRSASAAFAFGARFAALAALAVSSVSSFRAKNATTLLS